MIDVLKKFFKFLFSQNEVNQDILKLRAEKLFLAIGYVIMSATYIKDALGRGATYCHIAALDLFDSKIVNVWNNNIKVGESETVTLPMGNVLKMYNYDISSIMPDNNIDNILNAPIPGIYEKCIVEDGYSIRIITPEMAQEFANQGIPILIISKDYNHAAIVCPDMVYNEEKGEMVYRPYDPQLGVYTGNAGENNDYMYMSDPRGYGAVNWKDREIIYVQFKIIGNNEFVEVVK